MAQRKSPKESVRKIGKIGTEKNHSFYLTLPMEFVKALGWQEGQRVTVRRVGKKLHILDQNFPDQN